MNPKVSVIMSEYNTEEKHLRQSIESILNQSFRNFEFIIINDGSSNKLIDIVNSYEDERVRIINNKENLGLARSLNRGIEASRGKYLVRMDTDDISHKNRIEKQLKFIENNPEYSVVGTSINLITDGDKKYPKHMEGEIDKTAFVNGTIPVHPTVIMNKEDVLEIGMYQTTNVNRSEDFVLWAELLLADKRIYILNNILVDYRVELADYKKRKLSTRGDGIRNRIKYYKKLNAPPHRYLSVVKKILAGILPSKVMHFYHTKIKG